MKILEEIINRIVVKKKYPYLHEIARKDTSMVKMTKDLAWTQIGYLVLNNVDALLLMAFNGPVMVSIYTTYNYILRFLNEVASRVELSSVYSFGNVFAKKEDDRVYPLFKEFLMLFILIAFSMSITFMIGIRGFVSVWVGKENYILSYLTVVLFTSTLFLNIMYYPLVALINADGLFKDNKKSLVYISDEFKKGYQKIITSYSVLEEYENNTSLLDVQIETGKTHQIRAHLAHIGHPIIGDGKYGINKINKEFNLKYQKLCSYKLKFNFSTDSGILNYLNGKSFELKDKF